MTYSLGQSEDELSDVISQSERELPEAVVNMTKIHDVISNSLASNLDGLPEVGSDITEPSSTEALQHRNSSRNRNEPRINNF